MTFRQFLKNLNIPAAALGLMTLCHAQESLVTNVATFEIPFDVDQTPGQPVEGFAVLFGTLDGGAWEKLQTVPAGQQNFQFSAPRDGSYGFAVRMMDAQGNLQSAVEGCRPELEVVVDSAAPRIQLEAYEVSPGQVMIGWKCADPRLDPMTLVIEYTEGRDSRWKSLRVNPAASGQTAINAAPGAVISVRGSISDSAGNRGEGSAQLELSRNRIENPTQVPTPPPLITGQALGPSPFAPVPAAPNPGSLAAGAFGQPQPPGNAASTWGSPSVNNASSASLPAGFNGAIPQSQGPADIGNGNPLPGSTGDFGGADASPLVNTSVFDIAYQIDDVGPSGVGAVELFVTEDGGQQWFKYGMDEDLRSPIQVDVQGEGTFGFAVRVRNGLGFSDTPPQPGEAPTIVVSVDQTPPQIEFPQPALTAEGNGVVMLKWRLLETNLAGNPVRLEFANAPAGPWTPVFDWQPDTGGSQWAVRPGTPPAIYFRLLARDAAGNIGVAQTPQPVMIDMKRPVARSLRVQAASSTTPVIPR